MISTEQFISAVVTKFVETSPKYSDPRTKQLIQDVHAHVQSLNIQFTTNQIDRLTVDYIIFSDQLQYFLVHTINNKYKDFLVINGHNDVIFMSGGHIQYVVYLYHAIKPDSLEFALKIYFDSSDTSFLKTVLNQEFLNYMETKLLDEKTTSTSHTNQIFKNKNQEILKFKLNFYMNQVQNMIQQVPQDLIQQILDKFSQYNPILSGPTAMLRAIYPDKYFAMQFPDYSKQERNCMVIFISCLDISRPLCKSYSFGPYQVFVSKIKGQAKLYNSDYYNPLIQVLEPLHALRTVYISTYSPHLKTFLFSLAVSATIKLQKKFDLNQHTLLYSKKNHYLPNIQSSTDQLISFLAYDLHKHIKQN